MQKGSKLLTPLLALVLCLGLVACGNIAEDEQPSDEVVGNDWRVTGVVRDSGIITRSGEDIAVLVCVHAEDATFYYDSENQVLFDFVDYPVAIQGDPWESYQSIDFSDRNDDGNSDVTMIFEENGDTTRLVWFWDADAEGYVFQPEESSAMPDGDSYLSWNTLTGEDFEADRTCWQGEDGSQLLLCLDTDNYTYRTWYGRTGTGTLFQDEGGLGLQFCDIYTDHYYYLVRENDGFMLRHVNGEDGTEWGEMNGLHFEPSSVEMTPFDISLLNGTWQNALGKTYAFNTERMRVIECSDDSRVLSSGPLYDKAGGSGPYITGDEILYPCLSAAGNALVLFADGNAPRAPGSRGTGVFYRNGDVETYADLENASFGETDGRLWYCDGIQYFALPSGYTLSEDGRAYNRTNKPFAPDWKEDRYDPVSVWGDNWLDENWGSNQ